MIDIIIFSHLFIAAWSLFVHCKLSVKMWAETDESSSQQWGSCWWVLRAGQSEWYWSETLWFKYFSSSKSSWSHHFLGLLQGWQNILLISRLQSQQFWPRTWGNLQTQLWPLIGQSEELASCDWLRAGGGGVLTAALVWSYWWQAARVTPALRSAGLGVLHWTVVLSASSGEECWLKQPLARLDFSAKTQNCSHHHNSQVKSLYQHYWSLSCSHHHAPATKVSSKHILWSLLPTAKFLVKASNWSLPTWMEVVEAWTGWSAPGSPASLTPWCRPTRASTSGSLT